jgi:hypothetical protein
MNLVGTQKCFIGGVAPPFVVSVAEITLEKIPAKKDTSR